MGAERILGMILAWLATYAIHSTVLITVAWALAAVLGRILRGRATLAAARERLWKLAIFGGIATATLSSAGLGASLGRWRLRLELRPPASESRETPSSSVPTAPSASPELRPQPSEVFASRAADIAPGWMTPVAGVWLAGVALGAAAWLRDRRRLTHGLRGRERIASGPAFELLADLTGRVRARTHVALSRAPDLASPITLGILRPEICIPARAESSLLHEELEALLAHELSHALRRDPLLLALCRGVEVVLFFHPLVRFARARLLDEVEVLCDERAASLTHDPASLASCLAEVATWVVAGSRDGFALAMVARGTARGSRLERRVRGLLDVRRGSSPDRARKLLAPATLALALAALAAPAVSLEAGPTGPAMPARARAGPAADLESAVRELATGLSSLETEYAALASDPAWLSFGAPVRERILAVGTRLRSLREMRARLDALIGEGLTQER